ncbi:MAG: copper amine oxidase N-terminal domain-containing protein [Cellulosilyticaceae bacterium]
MKQRKMKLIILGLVMGLWMSVLSVMAKDISVEIDGRPLNTTQKPVTREGVTLVPMRAIFEALGMEIEWNEKEQNIAAIKGNQTIVLTLYGYQAFLIDADEYRVERATLTYPAVSINNTTYVPLRFVGEALGADVKWDPQLQQITIISGDGKLPVSTKSAEQIMKETEDNLNISCVYGGQFYNYPGKIVGPQIEHSVKNPIWSNKMINDVDSIVSVSGDYDGMPVVISFSFNMDTIEFELDGAVLDGVQLSFDDADVVVRSMIIPSIK